MSEPGRGGAPPVCSSPLEGSQRCRGSRSTAHPGPVCSSPLEGSQLPQHPVTDPALRESAHHPWRDRNLAALRWARASLASAHHPWRDRNGSRPRSRSSWAAVCSSPLEGSQPSPAQVQVLAQQQSAHHPWRDRNAQLSRYTRSCPYVCSSPLEGSQRCGGEGPGGRLRSLLITPGGIATAECPDSPGTSHVCSSPLEGSQRCSGRAVMGDWGLLITPGGIATSWSRSPPRPLPPRSAHHPWRDRNPRSSTLTWRTCWSAHHPWRDRNTLLITGGSPAICLLITPGGGISGPGRRTCWFRERA